MRRSRPRRWVIFQIESNRVVLHYGLKKYLCDPEKKVGVWRFPARWALKFATKLEAETHILTKMTTDPEFIGKLGVTWTTER